MFDLVSIENVDLQIFYRCQYHSTLSPTMGNKGTSSIWALLIWRLSVTNYGNKSHAMFWTECIKCHFQKLVKFSLYFNRNGITLQLSSILNISSGMCLWFSWPSISNWKKKEKRKGQNIFLTVCNYSKRINTFTWVCMQHFWPCLIAITFGECFWWMHSVPLLHWKKVIKIKEKRRKAA